MIEAFIDHEISLVCPSMRIGWLLFSVNNNESEDTLKGIIHETAVKISKSATVDSIHDHPVIHATRQAYKSMGKDPSRYRPSAEALMRRLVMGKDLYTVNCVVDIINLLSVESGFSIGGYDFEKIKGSILFKKGRNEPYLAIGRGNLNIENLPVLYDEIGAFGSPTSDSVRTSITFKTQKILLAFFDFNGDKTLMQWMQRATDLYTAFTFATNIEISLHKSKERH